MVIALRVQRGFVLAICCLALPIVVFGCGSGGSNYAVGDCLEEDVNEEGEAVKVSCSWKDSFTVEELARNGGQPDCGYDGKIIYKGSIRTIPNKYVTDAVSGTTYCGRDNFNTIGYPIPTYADDES